MNRHQHQDKLDTRIIWQGFLRSHFNASTSNYNFLDTNEKIEKLMKEIQIIKRRQMQIRELKNIIIKMKNCCMSSIVEVT